MTRVQTNAGLVQVNEDGSAFWLTEIYQYTQVHAGDPEYQGTSFILSTMTDRELALFRELIEERNKHETK